MEQRIAASDRLEAAMADMLAEGFTDPIKLTELGRLGAQLVAKGAEDSPFLTIDNQMPCRDACAGSCR